MSQRSSVTTLLSVVTNVPSTDLFALRGRWDMRRLRNTSDVLTAKEFRGADGVTRMRLLAPRLALVNHGTTSPARHGHVTCEKVELF